MGTIINFLQAKKFFLLNQRQVALQEDSLALPKSLFIKPDNTKCTAFSNKPLTQPSMFLFGIFFTFHLQSKQSTFRKRLSKRDTLSKVNLPISKVNPLSNEFHYTTRCLNHFSFKDKRIHTISLRFGKRIRFIHRSSFQLQTQIKAQTFGS